MVHSLPPINDPRFCVARCCFSLGNNSTQALFEGGEEKSHFEVLRELISADEPAPSYEELDDRGRDLVEDIREYQARLKKGRMYYPKVLHRGC